MLSGWAVANSITRTLQVEDGMNIVEGRLRREGTPGMDGL